MKLKLLYSLAAGVVFCAASFAQTSSSSTAALPAAPGTANEAAAPAADPNATKVAAINVEQAIFMSNEGQRDIGALQKKFEPKTTDLKSKNDEIEALKKQATATGITADKKGDLERQIDLKQKAFDRERQDAQEDYSSQQAEIGQRIFKKMGPVIMKYARENKLGLIVDTSTPWPNSPVLWANPASMDITQAVVEAYNAESGVSAPAAGSTGGAARSTPGMKSPTRPTTPSK